jgi:hypothetical protein
MMKVLIRNINLFIIKNIKVLISTVNLLAGVLGGTCHQLCNHHVCITDWALRITA